MSDWRMRRKCSNCPFASRGPGLSLRRSLSPGRWKEILNSLANGNFFPCHKTTKETWDGSERVCAGSIDWQEKHGASSAYVRLCQYRDRTEQQKARPKPRPSLP